MASRRTTLDIYKDIIDSIEREGKRISRIADSAHLNHSRLREALDVLTSNELVEKASEDPEKWKATDDGIEYSDTLAKLKSYLERGNEPEEL